MDANTTIPGLEIDRSRITHGENKRMMVLKAQAERADRDSDADAIERILNEGDTMIERMVVSVPDGWLPDGVTTAKPGWLDCLTVENYDALMRAATPQAGARGN